MSNLEISKNIKMIEWLKAEILSDTAELYMRLAENKDEDDLGEAASNIIIATYLLMNRLGISFMQLDLKMQEVLRHSVTLSKACGKDDDLVALLKHKQVPIDVLKA